ncbi:hypothetical protein FE633_10710 [Streptomyces montanus]|uniref:Uncharacterized protein n=1 Tax=Streptomyces montanus TaxID=2580423 RepID=A0A5R9FTL0_9ACTN|nr:hypothetical protein [Streptomyces montanus]TLS46019.1 hypothetical protein FE633_10710 [Streptomyces montanus]
MPDAELAARIRTEITRHPRHHDQHAWLAGTRLLRPDQAPDCGTTLCVAGWTAHLTGYTLERDSGIVRAFRPGIPRGYVDDVARVELGLTEDDARTLFATRRTRAEVLAALGQLADGAAAIDWPTIWATQPPE